MAVYTGKQLEVLFEAIQDVYQSADATGCDGDLTVVTQSSVLAMKQRMDDLKKLDQAFVLGVHTHRHGDSTYDFVVPRRHDGSVAFNEDDLENFLQEEFEPDREEFLNVIVFDDEPTIVLADHPEHAALIEAAGIRVDDDPEVPGACTWAGCERSFATRADALKAAAFEVAGDTMGFHDLSSEFWDGLSLEQKVELVGEAFEKPAETNGPKG